MDAKEAIGILRGDVSPSSVLHRGIADGMGADALELLHWWFDEDHEPEREAVRVKREEAGTRWTSDQWIAAVLDAMEKEGKG